jgi:hypothetical protein
MIYEKSLDCRLVDDTPTLAKLQISQILKCDQLCIDVYNIGTF